MNLLKPPGMTSAAAVGYIRRLLPRGARVGHAGTLDPEAAGVLPIMIGRAARLSDYIMAGEKEYICVLATGVSTDTQDAQGMRVGGTGEAASADEVRTALKRFTGEILQTPSPYSALKQDGRRMCDILRDGGEVAPQPRAVTIHALEYLGEAEGGHLLRVRCSKGTYIRALCDDIGKALGCGGYMRFLLRTETAGFMLKDAITLEDARADLAANVAPIDAPLAHMPAVYAPIGLARAIRCGNPVPVNALRGATEAAVARLYADVPIESGGSERRFAGIVELSGAEMRFKAMLLNTEGMANASI